MSRYKSDSSWLGLLVQLAIYLVALGAIMLGFRGCGALQCDEVEQTTGRKTQFRLISGCYVQVEGRWIPQDSWRGEQDLERPNTN